MPGHQWTKILLKWGAKRKPGDTLQTNFEIRFSRPSGGSLFFEKCRRQKGTDSHNHKGLHFIKGENWLFASGFFRVRNSERQT